MNIPGIVDLFQGLPEWVKIPVEIVAIGIPFLGHELYKANELCNRLIRGTNPRMMEGSTTSD